MWIGWRLGAAAVVLSGCTDESPDPGPAPAPTGETTIGPAGGTLQSTDRRFTLTVPAGALAEATTISVAPVDASELPEDLRVDLPAYRLEPSGLTFAAPIHTVLEVPVSEVTQGPGAPVWSPMVLSDTGELETLANATSQGGFGDEDVRIEGDLQHFSTYLPVSWGLAVLNTEAPFQALVGTRFYRDLVFHYAWGADGLDGSTGTITYVSVRAQGAVVDVSPSEWPPIPLAPDANTTINPAPQYECREVGVGSLTTAFSFELRGMRAGVEVVVSGVGWQPVRSIFCYSLDVDGPANSEDGGPLPGDPAGGDTGSSGDDYGGQTTCGGQSCSASQLCDDPSNQCGQFASTCVETPTSCPAEAPQVCGCDGQVHASACAARQAGVDVDSRGSCTAPGGTFPCGEIFCTEGSEYCHALSGTPTLYSCRPFPEACGGTPTCDCLTPLCSETFPSCDDVPGGSGLALTCFGHDIGCATDADCSSTRNPILGGCETANGVCQAIEGGGARALGETCDSSSDCASGICDLAPPSVPVGHASAQTYRAGGRNVCTEECEGDEDCAGLTGGYCRMSFYGSDPRLCVLPCTVKAQCSTPGSVICDGETSRCTPPGGAGCLPGGTNRVDIANVAVVPESIGAFGTGSLSISWTGDWCSPVTAHWIQPATDVLPSDTPMSSPVAQVDPIELAGALSCGSSAQTPTTTVTLINGNGVSSAAFEVGYSCAP
jgi:hypothetical protein